MKKVIIFFTIIANLYSNSMLWIYTDLKYNRPIEYLKSRYIMHHPGIKIKILKAPYNILIKKLKFQKKADLFITEQKNNFFKYRKLFNEYYKIGIKKPAVLSLNKETGFKQIKNKQLIIGVVRSDNIYNLFMSAIKKYGGRDFYIEVKLFNKKRYFNTSFSCKKALFKGDVDVCIDWIGTGFWSRFKNIKPFLINTEYYKQVYVYAAVTKYSKNKSAAKKFINFIVKELKSVGKKKEKVNFLLPDLPL